MIKRLFLAVLLGLFLVIVGVACSDKSNDPGQADLGDGVVQEDPKLPDVTDQPAEIVFYSTNNDPVESFDYRFGNSLREKFPNFTIKYIQSGPGTGISELITSGTRFDIYFHSIGNFENVAFSHEIETDMTDLIKTHKVDLGRLEQTVVNAVQQASGGNFYGIPVNTNNLVLYYNTELFDRFGVDYPQDGMTWDEMTEMSRRLTRVDDGVQYYGYTHSSQHTIRMNPLSIPNADVETHTATINKLDSWRRFFQSFYIDPFRGQGYLDAIRETNSMPGLSAFTRTRNVGMYMYLSSMTYVSAPDLQDMGHWDMVSVPTFPDRPNIGSQSYPFYFGITKMAQNPDAAMAVLKYMISDEFQTELARKGIMPVVNNPSIQAELGKDSLFPEKNWGAVFHNKFAPIPPKALYDAQLVNIYHNAGTDMTFDRADMNSALRSAEERAEQMISNFLANQK